MATKKPATTYSARETARLVATRSGRPCDAKRVRAYVRDHFEAYDDGEYTSHAYTAAFRDRVVNAMVSARRASRSQSAASGRKRTAATPGVVKAVPTPTVKRAASGKPAAVKPAAPVTASGPVIP